ncbi:hypothetical protein DASC09_044310 [Saccharomycopsis crataegensis]|uniref:N-acetyltransferase domain-containing protein n=1 Tax=Saccharomycopsis crataegensis TaxID=43959 RepID=A0AAV5QQT8_9ASCO|nr:hypothetical protein DASC09_044310 [Saccharomycopsis crataegensis]
MFTPFFGPGWQSFKPINPNDMTPEEFVSFCEKNPNYRPMEQWGNLIFGKAMTEFLDKNSKKSDPKPKDKFILVKVDDPSLPEHGYYQFPFDEVCHWEPSAQGRGLQSALFEAYPEIVPTMFSSKNVEINLINQKSRVMPSHWNRSAKADMKVAISFKRTSLDYQRYIQFYRWYQSYITHIYKNQKKNIKRNIMVYSPNTAAFFEHNDILCDGRAYQLWNKFNGTSPALNFGMSASGNIAPNHYQVPGGIGKFGKKFQNNYVNVAEFWEEKNKMNKAFIDPFNNPRTSYHMNFPDNEDALIGIDGKNIKNNEAFMVTDPFGDGKKRVRFHSDA